MSEITQTLDSSKQSDSTVKPTNTGSTALNPAPEKPWATSAALRRCAIVAEKLRTMHEESMEFCSTGRNDPPQSLYEAIEGFYESLVSEPNVDHPQCTWKLLDFAVEFAKEIYGHISYWRQELPPKAITFIAELSNQLESVRSPRPAQVARLTQLEPLSEVDKLPGISAAQICKMYNKLTADGQPDVGWLRDAREGKADVPRYLQHELPTARIPHLGILDAIVGDFRAMAINRGDQDPEESMSYVYEDDLNPNQYGMEQ